MKMEIRGILVDTPYLLDPIYRVYVVCENDQKVLNVHIMKAIYGLLVSALLKVHGRSYYLQFWSILAWWTSKLKEVRWLFIACGWSMTFHCMWMISRFRKGQAARWLTNLLDGSKLSVKWWEHWRLLVEKSTIILEWSLTAVLKVKYLWKWLFRWSLWLRIFQVRSWPLSRWHLHGMKTFSRWPFKKAEQFHTFTAQGLFLYKRGHPDNMPRNC